jgi:hypothetical protein
MPETKTKILVCNAGSSSLKFSFFDAEDEVLLADGGIDWIRKPTRLVFRRADQPEIREELKLENTLMQRLESSMICELAHRPLCAFLKTSELWDIALSMAASATPTPSGSRLRSSGRSKNSDV